MAESRPCLREEQGSKKEARPAWGLAGYLNWNQRVIKEENTLTSARLKKATAQVRLVALH
jgi:hypothetical protein